MRRESHVRFWESAGVRFPRATQLLFGGWQVTVSKDEKATGEERYLRSGTSGAVVAGNRYGLPDTIKAPAGAANLWRTFAEALKKAKAPVPVVPAA
jgi:hypothetical protein